MYKGLQATHQTAVEAARARDAAAQQQLSQLQAQVSGLETVRTELKTQLDAATTNLQTTTASAQEVQAARDAALAAEARTRMLLLEFPDLAGFEAKGLLLKTGSEEELRTSFTEFRGALNQVSAAGAQNAVGGATPPAPGTTPAGQKSADELYDDAMKASSEGNMDEYNRLMDLIRKLPSSGPLSPP
jgi:hypothetical protein